MNIPMPKNTIETKTGASGLFPNTLYIKSEDGAMFALNMRPHVPGFTSFAVAVSETDSTQEKFATYVFFLTPEELATVADYFNAKVKEMQK